MVLKLICQGAEAHIFLENGSIVKKRISKSYRHPELDLRMRKKQTKREAKVLEQLGEMGVSPKLISMDKDDMTLTMELVEGDKCADILSESNYLILMKELGKLIAKLHDLSIIHGDLTTSNLIVSSDNSIKLIDFGLSYHSLKIEDRAVDIHVLKEALEAKHSDVSTVAFIAFSASYLKNTEKGKNTLERLEEVELRGRYHKKSAKSSQN